MMSSEVTICQNCGDAGYFERLVYCAYCKVSAEHSYCLDMLTNYAEEVLWSCGECTETVSKLEKLSSEEGKYSSLLKKLSDKEFIPINVERKCVEDTEGGKEIRKRRRLILDVETSLDKESMQINVEQKCEEGTEGGKEIKKRRRLILDAEASSDEGLESALVERKFSSQDATRVIEHDSFTYSKPIWDPIWRGSFNTGSYNHVRATAHLSNKACARACEGASMLTTTMLSLDKLPRVEAWPKSFSRSQPTDDNIALFVFPETHRDEIVFHELVDEVNCLDLVLRLTLDSTELLLFSSLMLPEFYHKFCGYYYLWGVFRRRQLPLSNISNDRCRFNQFTTYIATSERPLIGLEGDMENEDEREIFFSQHKNCGPVIPLNIKDGCGSDLSNSSCVKACDQSSFQNPQSSELYLHDDLMPVGEKVFDFVSAEDVNNDLVLFPPNAEDMATLLREGNNGNILELGHGQPVSEEYWKTCSGCKPESSFILQRLFKTMETIERTVRELRKDFEIPKEGCNGLDLELGLGSSTSEEHKLNRVSVLGCHCKSMKIVQDNFEMFKKEPKVRGQDKFEKCKTCTMVEGTSVLDQMLKMIECLHELRNLGVNISIDTQKETITSSLLKYLEPFIPNYTAATPYSILIELLVQLLGEKVKLNQKMHSVPLEKGRNNTENAFPNRSSSFPINKIQESALGFENKAGAEIGSVSIFPANKEIQNTASSSNSGSFNSFSPTEEIQIPACSSNKPVNLLSSTNFPPPTQMQKTTRSAYEEDPNSSSFSSFSPMQEIQKTPVCISEGTKASSFTDSPTEDVQDIAACGDQGANPSSSDRFPRTKSISTFPPMKEIQNVVPICDNGVNPKSIISFPPKKETQKSSHYKEDPYSRSSISLPPKKKFKKTAPCGDKCVDPISSSSFPPKKKIEKTANPGSSSTFQSKVIEETFSPGSDRRPQSTKETQKTSPSLSKEAAHFRSFSCFPPKKIIKKPALGSNIKGANATSVGNSICKRSTQLISPIANHRFKKGFPRKRIWKTAPRH